MSKKLDERHPLSLEKARLYVEKPKTEEEVADYNARVENFNARMVAEGFPAKDGLFKKKIVGGVLRTVYS